MILGVNLIWCDNLHVLITECGLFDGDKVLCVDADGIVRRLQWDETREVLTNANGVMYEPTDFVEFCNDHSL